MWKMFPWRPGLAPAGLTPHHGHDNLHCPSSSPYRVWNLHSSLAVGLTISWAGFWPLRVLSVGPGPSPQRGSLACLLIPDPKLHRRDHRAVPEKLPPFPEIAVEILVGNVHVKPHLMKSLVPSCPLPSALTGAWRKKETCCPGLLCWRIGCYVAGGLNRRPCTIVSINPCKVSRSNCVQDTATTHQEFLCLILRQRART